MKKFFASTMIALTMISMVAEVAVKPLGGGGIETAIAFFKSGDWLDPLQSGYLDDYQDRRFVPPWER